MPYNSLSSRAFFITAKAGSAITDRIVMRIPTNREPTPPGEMLLEEFLKPMGLTQRQLAEGIRVPYQRINEIINGRRGISASTALRLSKFFGNSPEFWMNLQRAWDLYRSSKKEKEILDGINPWAARKPRETSRNLVT